MLTVALTGGIGSGKTTVADHFARHGAAIIDADVISHQLTASQGAAMPCIREAFGEAAVRGDGSLDRAWMRQRVFSDPSAHAKLQAILHPLIRTQMCAQLAQTQGDYALLVIPLLLETGQQQLAQRILVVDVLEQQQIERVHARSGLAVAEIERIMAHQISRAARLAAADDVIDNSGTPETLAAQVAPLHQRYLQLGRMGTRSFIMF